MRSLTLALLGLAACETEDGTAAYDEYDPQAPVEEYADPADMPAAPANPEAAAQGAWLPQNTEVLVALTAPQIGRWTWKNAEPGEAAGEAACQALGADHVCSQAELAEAEARGELQGAPEGTTVWAFSEDAAGSCNLRTYPTGDRSWGNFAAIVTNEDGQAALERHAAEGVEFDPECLKDAAKCPAVIPTGFECNVARSIACCS